MSKSYRKHPVERWGSRHHKRRERNRRFRHMKNKETPSNGAAYKKYISDYWSYPTYYFPWREAKKYYQRLTHQIGYHYFYEEYPTEKDYYDYWEKYCRRK